MEGVRRHTFWGWEPAARVVLAGLAVVAAVGLGVAAGPRNEGSGASAPVLIVDPNTVPAEVISALPRCGPAMVEKIVAERERRPFASLADMSRRVRGMGPVTSEALAKHLRFEPADADPQSPALAARAPE